MKATNGWFIVEIDIEENSNLVEELKRKFFIKQINQRRVEKKLGMVIFWEIYLLHFKLPTFK